MTAHQRTICIYEGEFYAFTIENSAASVLVITTFDGHPIEVAPGDSITIRVEVPAGPDRARATT